MNGGTTISLNSSLTIVGMCFFSNFSPLLNYEYLIVSERFLRVIQNPLIYFGSDVFVWVAGNGHFCQGGLPFPAHLSDKHRLPTSKYLRGGFLFSRDIF